uniref:DUF6273 domain-containing protein n=1 Tax=Dulem virus 34 TaxID=3145752 RepID=A0AAU8B594_9CAUD
MKIKKSVYEPITWEQLEDLAASGRATEVLTPFDEIDLTLEGGEAVTVVVAAHLATTADKPAGIRFMFKDCLNDPHRMNNSYTNAGGYKDSEGRRYILEEVYPRLPADLRAVIRPRKIVENVREGVLEYEDPLWLPSETDMFGRGEASWQGGRADGPDDFQLPIFMTERDRVKMRQGYGTTSYFCRSVYSGYSNFFCLVGADGTATIGYAANSRGVAPGFDL